MKDNGFHDGDVRVEEPGGIHLMMARLALIAGEAHEAMTEVHKGNFFEPSEKIPPYSGVEDELADVILRIMDFAATYNLKVGPAVLAKGRYNKTRPYKHGGKLV